jgi:nitroreductase/NAD-dependent dihydropyrimidine dehydrogenase PreA subunit
MLDITIDADVCRKDGLCAMACPRGIIEQEEKGTVPKIVEAFVDKCFLCGQCVSICPHGVISHSHFPEGTVTPIKSDNVPTYDQVLELIHSRRTKRLFKDKPVEKDVIEKVLEAARFAPSGHNEQSTEFIVIQGKENVREVGDLTAKGIGRMVVPFRYSIGAFIMGFVLGRRGAKYVAKMAPEIEGLVSMYNEGKDWIMREAPLLILFCADSAAGSYMSINANLAVQNATLAAEALGLGSMYAGFVMMANNYSGGHISKHVSLPETHEIYGALLMGYPRLKFKKWPERNPAIVKWMNGATNQGEE